MAQTAHSFAYPGATPSISAYQNTNGIVWAAENGFATLHAYDATTLQELYNSNQAPGARDQFGMGNKFITPTVAHGKVYVGTTSSVAAFGPFIATPPSIVSLTPNSGGGTPVTFTAVYSDVNGAGSLSQASLLISTAVNDVGACDVYYSPQGNQLYLRNDAGTAWLAPTLTLGVAGTVSSSQCTLNAGSSSVSTAGNNLTLNLALSFNSTFVSPKNVYLYAAGLGLNSGWVQKGTWTPNPSAGPPAIVSLSPNSGSGPVTFTAVYSDPNGAADLNQAMLLVNTSLNGVGACEISYYPQGNQLYLRNDAGTAWLAALTLGVAGTVSNSQCTLDAGSSSVSKSGSNLTLKVALSFNSGFVASKNVYLYANGLSGQNSGWVQKGNWTPSSSGPPVVLSLLPNSGSGPVTFTAVYSDPNGAADLNQASLLVNTRVNAAGACYVYYYPQGNQLYLRNDAGTAWLAPALTPGVAGTVSNSQCTVNAGSSSVSTTGNNLTLNVALSFNSALLSPENLYLYAAGLSSQNSGWVQKGTWTPNPSAGPPTIVSLSPNSGTGPVTFTAVYSDPNTAADLNQAMLLVNTAVASASACQVYYYPQGNQLYLRNDAGTAWLAALTPGVAGTVSNSQCTLNAGSSSVSTAGNSLTLNAALSFNSAFLNSKDVYLYASGLSGQNSGWVEKGTWTPNPSAGPPAIVSLSPNSGTGPVTFTAVYSDPNGAADLNQALLLANTGVNAAGACYVYYYPQANQLSLRNDAGTAWLAPALTPGLAGTVSNSQCTLNAGSSSVSTAGNNLTLNVALSFNSALLSPENLYLYAAGLSGQNSGWVQKGTWTPNPSAGPPAIVSLLPNSGSGTPVTFTAVYSDPNGAADLNEAMLLVNRSINAAGACYVYYNPQGNLLYLLNDAGTARLAALTPGVSGTVSNSQCTLNAGSSSVSTAGNNLTLNAALTFSSYVCEPKERISVRQGA